MTSLQYTCLAGERGTKLDPVPIRYRAAWLRDVSGAPVPGRLHSLIHELTREDLSRLAGFAGYRLARVRLDPSVGEDFVQDALLAVLRGAQSQSYGRHPRSVDLENHVSFLRYLRGAIASRVEAERRRLARVCVQEPLNEDFARNRPGSSQGHQSDFEFEDLRNRFFEQLLERTPLRLSHLVVAWKQNWDEGEIPLLGRHRRNRTQLRILALRVFKQITQPTKTIT